MPEQPCNGTSDLNHPAPLWKSNPTCSWRCTLLCLVLIGIYVILFLSIFEIYYISPIVTGVQPIPSNANQLATHVVFILVDGARADLFFSGSMENTPFMKDLVLNRASWGVSYTQAPTESRPGHAALMGGFFEDLSAAKTTWKWNPVPFDSLFNRTAKSWAWSGDDIILSYAYPNNDRIRINFVPQEIYRRFHWDSVKVDNWVVDQFLDLVEDSQHGFFADLNTKEFGMDATRRGHFAFLHLDSVDRVGHTYHPKSSMFESAMHELDGQLRRLSDHVEKAAARTSARVAFVITGDHGTIEDGGHGGSSPTELATAFIAWGAGIRNSSLLAPDKRQMEEPIDNQAPKHFMGRVRSDLVQIDICPLIALLLGTSIPVNSVGRAPLHILNAAASDKYRLIRANCLELHAQLRVKLANIRPLHSSLFFKQYEYLKEDQYDHILSEAERSASSGNYDHAIRQLEELQGLAIRALDYYYTYDRPYLQFCVICTFVLLSLELLCSTQERENSFLGPQLQICCLAGKSILIIALLWISTYAFRNSLLCTLIQVIPICQLLRLLGSKRRVGSVQALISNVAWDPRNTFQRTQVVFFVQLLFLAVTSIGLLELLIQSFYDRKYLTLAFLVLPTWPWLDSSFAPKSKILRISWILLCWSIAPFPWLPAIDPEGKPTISGIAGLIAALLCVVYHWKSPTSSVVSKYNKKFSLILTALLALTSIAVLSMSTQASVNWKIRVLCWMELVLLPILNFLWLPQSSVFRVFIWSQTFLIAFLPICIGYEGLFFVLFILLCWLWICMESQASSSPQLPQHTSKSEHADNAKLEMKTSLLPQFRRGLIFLSMVLLCLFVTADLMSFRRFDLASTKFFTTDSNTNQKRIFFAIKLSLPIIYLGFSYTVVVGKSDVGSWRYTLTLRDLQRHLKMLLVLTNFLAVHFFLWLRVEGSWLEIGMSIVRYIIPFVITPGAILLILLVYPMLRLSWRSCVPRHDKTLT